MNTLGKLLTFLDELDGRQISFKLVHSRSGAIMVDIAVPGERWEVEFFEDGHVEVEVFRSTSDGLEGEEALDRLFEKFSD